MINNSTISQPQIGLSQISTRLWACQTCLLAQEEAVLTTANNHYQTREACYLDIFVQGGSLQKREEKRVSRLQVVAQEW